MSGDLGPWRAPAKLNLGLRVVGRRADGYHLIQTLFQLIDLCDELSFSLRDDGEVRLLDPIPGVTEGEDLCSRAARLLQARSGTGLGADIRLRKQIPAGAGLGGGSSDAATTLIALDQLWDTGLGPEGLMPLAPELGADVAVFLGGVPALGEGVGERLTPVELPEAWYLVAWPGVSVATAEVFETPELTRNSPATTIRALLAAGGRNDLEPAVCSRHPEVAATLSLLRDRGEAWMSGSGSAVYAPRPTREAAERLQHELSAAWSEEEVEPELSARRRSWVVPALARSPTHERAGAPV